MVSFEVGIRPVLQELLEYMIEPKVIFQFFFLFFPQKNNGQSQLHLDLNSVLNCILLSIESHDQILMGLNLL